MGSVAVYPLPPQTADEYAYGIPNPKHTPRLKYHIPKINTGQLSSLTELRCHPIKTLAAASLPEYADTHSLLTGYLRP